MSSAERRDGPSTRPTCGVRNGLLPAATNLRADPEQHDDSHQHATQPAPGRRSQRSPVLGFGRARTASTERLRPDRPNSCGAAALRATLLLRHDVVAFLLRCAWQPWTVSPRNCKSLSRALCRPPTWVLWLEWTGYRPQIASRRCGLDEEPFGEALRQDGGPGRFGLASG
jgi:hypothetical protein